MRISTIANCGSRVGVENDKRRKKERDLECRVAVPPPRSTRDEESFRKPQKSLILRDFECRFEDQDETRDLRLQ